jgi:hypothetical protein
VCVSGYTKEPALIDKLLSMTLDESVRAQDVFYVFGTLAGNRHAMSRAWDFIKDNWDAIHKMFSSGFFFFIYLQTAECPLPPPPFFLYQGQLGRHSQNVFIRSVFVEAHPHLCQGTVSLVVL